VWTSNPNGALRVIVREPSQVSKYEFETRTAQFHVCARCGVVPVVTSRIDDNVYAVVSVNAFVNVDPAILRHAPSNLEGEQKSARLARRKRHWIAKVELVETEAEK
jgi:hypothetical protein